MACSDPDEIVLLKYIRDEVSDEEREWIECWLKEDETRNEIVLQLASIDYALYTKKRVESRNSLEAYSKVERHIRLQQTRKWIHRACFVAACFIGVLILSTAISFWMQKSVSIEKQGVTIQANAGMRSSFNLPDGTVVYLNSGSILSYFYNVKFQVLDPVINSYRFTGTFKNRQLSQILDYLQISSHVGYSIKQMVADDSLTVQQESVLLYKKQ